MPTGYTAKLMEKGQTFNEFVWTCARAFSALVDLRDEPLGAAIPERLVALQRLEKEAKEHEAAGRRMAVNIGKTIDGMVKAITKELQVVHEKSVRFYLEDELMGDITGNIYQRY